MNYQAVPSQIVSEFPINSFLESIAIAPDNTLFITNHYEGKVIRIGADGIPTTLAQIDGKATGLAFTGDYQLLLSGWNAENTCVIWRISLDGTTELLVEMPEAQFLNGLTRLDDNRFLIADSYRGAIWELNIGDRTVKIWLEHPVLARTSPEEGTPAVNGLKMFANFLYASNTQKQQIVKIPILADGTAGEPEIFVTGINIDDFAFDRAGNLYGATHVFNSVVKITADGSITAIAEIEQGMAGSTALAFGTDGNIYVTTNGGMSFPPASGIEPSKVVRLQIAEEGLSLV
ncbi:gluconolactonase [Pseudanabaena sp. UWO311]|uniref:SMP-30/gluconolactonase/LRE family protein n=1 Tax=Pseudanabaena sp. UWO311 TaxID=2487337 RepID=UPI001159BE92|nr:gluconolactonase [Pseudanabaena sp. UWO311]TYQ28890.1 gluconolactonase [Pseudanabaena sp. UWO311]